MDVNHEKHILVPEQVNRCEIPVVKRDQSSRTDSSDVQQIILENGIDKSQPQSKICVSQESDNSKCTVAQLGDSFCKSDETPTNDINVLARLMNESKCATHTENCLPDVVDKDAYDTHSDSIETLEEVSSNEDLHDEELSDSLVHQIQLTNEQKSCDTLKKPVVGSDCSAPGKCDSRSGNIGQDQFGSTDDNFESDPNSAMVGAACVRPVSLSLVNSVQSHNRNRSKSDDLVKVKDKKQTVRKEWIQSDTIEIQASRHQADAFNSEDFLSKSLPKGMIMRKGDLIEFVASDLEDKIRHSSPISLTGSSVSSRRSSLRSIHSFSSSTSTSMATSTASGMSRSPSSLYQQSPDDIPPIDPLAIIDLENQARLVADSIDLMMGNLRGSLHKMSAISVGCLDAYQRSVDITCDSVDSSIKSMYALMAKCEELSHNMKPVYHIAHQIKEIKRLLDLFEAQLTDK
ncbi:uncharacterized protein LOC121390273 [Gigantopelta aegis]|uniref:uncharacterized protein LOC121390273 n=1 Tax=Gigantopelta aegis TaxID=1735272 RepID=UPI001B88A9B6|nr:uncharacterized protein LOC121390273 [Gigantopelta aegis]